MSEYENEQDKGNIILSNEVVCSTESESTDMDSETEDVFIFGEDETLDEYDTQITTAGTSKKALNILTGHT